MAVTSFKRSLYSSNPDKYISFLAGNAAYDPGAFVSIASATGTGSSGTITFSSIPSTYTSLQIRYQMFTSVAGNALRIRFNGDTGTNYTQHYLYGDQSTVTAGGLTSRSFIAAGSNANGPSSTSPVVGIIDIHDYSSTTRNKTLRDFSGVDQNGAGDANLNSGLWMSTAAITSIECYTGSSNWTTSTVFALYGIKAA
jgi:hypothetical protein